MKIVQSTTGLLVAAALAACGVSHADHDSWQAGYD